MKSIVEQTAKRFCALTLTKPEWTHYAHLRVGLWHLLNYPAADALIRMRSGIRALNEIHGVANTDTGGYHESITRFYLWQIGTFLDANDRKRPEDDLAVELILEYGDKDLPLRYWSNARLMSREARLGWVEPDLAALR